MGHTIIDIIKALVIPAIPDIVKALQDTSETIAEGAIVEQLQHRGVLQAARVDPWLAAHPETPNA